MRTITPRRPRNGLFAVAIEVSPDDPNIDWTSQGGWRLHSACPAGGLWCCDTEFNEEADKPDFSSPLPQQFLPFTVMNVQGCMTGTSRTSGALDEARATNQMWHETNLEGWVSSGLEIGMCGAPGLQSLPDVTTTPGTGETVADAIKLLLSARTRVGVFDRPTLHLPAWYAGELTDSVHLTNAVDIAFGPGYGYWTNEPWAYLTGPVEYSIMEREYTPGSTLEERRRNMNYDLIETMALYRFDPCASSRVQLAV